MVSSVAVESCMRGHHIYQAIWNPFDGEELSCCIEQNNSHDPYAIAIMKRNTIVGHVPKKFLLPAIFSLRKRMPP